MYRGVWQATVHGVAETDMTEHMENACAHALTANSNKKSGGGLCPWLSCWIYTQWAAKAAL